MKSHFHFNEINGSIFSRYLTVFYCLDLQCHNRAYPDNGIDSVKNFQQLIDIVNRERKDYNQSI